MIVHFSEGELEEVLTTYTKINKSASIFLGGKTSGDPSVSHMPTTGTRYNQGDTVTSYQGEL